MAIRPLLIQGIAATTTDAAGENKFLRCAALTANTLGSRNPVLRWSSPSLVEGLVWIANLVSRYFIREGRSNEGYAGSICRITQSGSHLSYFLRSHQSGKMK